MGDYIIFLNTTDWTVFHLSQPASWTAPFWSQESSGAIADIFPDDSIDAELSGLDDNDPNFQQDIDIPSSLSDETGWFISDEQIPSVIETSAGTSSISQLIKQRELAK